MADDDDTAAPNAAETLEAMELKIASALRSRGEYLKEQADSLNMLKVRRLLEKDLGMEQFALDEHKKFIKLQVYEILEATGDGVDKGLKIEIGSSDAPFTEGKAGASVNGDQLVKDMAGPNHVEDNTTDHSPVLGLVSGDEKTQKITKKADGDDIKESFVKAALLKRASHFQANLDNITMAGVRRLLEGDLRIERYSLDPFKKFISRELDEIIKPPPASKSQSDKKISSKNIVSKKASKTKTVDNENNSESSESKMQESSEEDSNSRKHSSSKARTAKKQVLEAPKKRKLVTNPTKDSRKKSKSQENEDSDAGLDENSSENDGSHTPAVKNKASTPVYGKRVEQLKSIIKSCGIRIPPVIYKRAKQAPENKHESALIKELEEILSKEGLTSNPTEKEIKDVRRKKERERELEGIDMSNIVSSSRRRSTANFVAALKPKLPIESDDSQSDDEDDESDTDSDENDDIKDENDDPENEIDETDDPKDEIDEDDGEAKNGSQSQELEKGKDEDSD